MILRHTAVDPAGHVGMDKDFDASGVFPQNVVAAPAHDDAGPLRRQLPDHVGLGKKCLMADRDALVGEGGDADADGGDVQVEPAAGPLLRPGDKVGGKAALLRSLLDQCAVITGDAQACGQLLADQAAAASKLAADGHDIVAHETRLLIVWLQVRARLFIRTSCFFIL